MLKKVMVIGSGPIIIGQAAEFDYAGTQACKALKEEGLEVVLVNSNPATIMTDLKIASRVYLEPLNTESVAKIIAKERPDGLLPTLGGQTGLNLAVQLSEKGILENFQVKLLGTSLEAIEKAEDRDAFKATMRKINEPIPQSIIAHNLEEALSFAAKTGYPLIIRPAYTLGGTGGGFAHNEQELKEVVRHGLKASFVHQVLVEKSLEGWKEIEFEVMRDKNDNCITICSMENMDPMGIHTGDSIVVAPAQTLNDEEYQLLRSASLRIIRALGVEGGANIQFALNPQKLEYCVIEVNPRVSRSSALASKATGYPIARIAAKIAVGHTLDEIENPITGKTSAFFEPTIDYVVVKIPRWPFDKFPAADRLLGSQMKATGEVMALGRSFEAALLKAVRSLEIGTQSLFLPESWRLSEMEIEDRLSHADDQRLFIIAEAFRRKWHLEEIRALTHIDPWFLHKIKGIVEEEEKISAAGSNLDLAALKRKGFADSQLAAMLGVEQSAFYQQRKKNNFFPVYKMVDTCAAEFEAKTPYFYSVYEKEEEVAAEEKSKILVIGSGPIRIGQGIEFDYCSVHAVWAYQEEGYQTIIINSNPETVSTDFDTADRLYFEPLTVEDVLNVVEKEKPLGVVVQFGGQTSINLAAELEKNGVKIIGTSVKSIDLAEDRRKFAHFLDELCISQTEGDSAVKEEDAFRIAKTIGYPVVVRPSYVLGGRAMEVVHNEKELEAYIASAVKVSDHHPVLIDRYLEGREVEIDAVADGNSCLIAGIMEHIERAGIHSGDSMAVYPAPNLSSRIKEDIIGYTEQIARFLGIKGLLNIQFVVYEDKVYVLEVNPRASRTVPILSKVTGLPLVKIACQVSLGKTLNELGYTAGLFPEVPYYCVKAPVFSLEKLPQAEASLGPEMRSTGEVLGIAKDYKVALKKALAAAHFLPLEKGKILVSLAAKDRKEALPLLKEAKMIGFALASTLSTADFLLEEGLKGERITEEEALAFIEKGEYVLVVNTPTQGKDFNHFGFILRRRALENGICLFTSLDTFKAFLEAYPAEEGEPLALEDYLLWREKLVC